MKNLVLVGAPNSGKTSIYNWITGSRFRTVNYPGSTVEFSRGHSMPQYGEPVEVIDTPGIRSLDPLSPDEEVTIKTLVAEGANESSVVLVPVDATQLARHLFMVKRLQRAGFRVEVALTMTDLLKRKGLEIDIPALSKWVGADIYVVDGRLGAGIPEMMTRLRGVPGLAASRKIQIPELSTGQITAEYDLIEDAVERVVRSTSAATGPLKDRLAEGDPWSQKVDRWLLHPYLGPVFFVLIMGTLFTSIFWLAQPAMDFVDGLFSTWAEAVVAMGPESLIFDLLGNGLIMGVGSVLVFVPQIVILFFVMGVLEDSGYLARAATLVDWPLSKIGLNGRSFVPLLSGYACAIPAMMAARTISNPKERLLTLFAIPLMSCSARLPVYALLLGLLFSDQPLKAGLALTGIYFLSAIFGAVAVALVRRFVPNKSGSFFLLEVPTYRRPKVRFVLRQVLTRTNSYLRRAGLTIIMVSVTIWALATFPNYSESDAVAKLESSYLAQMGRWLDPVMAPMGGDWRVGVGVLSAFAAREVFVSTLAIVFHVAGEAEEEVEAGLSQVLSGAVLADGTKMFTPAVVLGLILYFMIALQCLATVAVAWSESGSKKFALIQLALFTIGGYLAAVALVQGLRALGVA